MFNEKFENIFLRNNRVEKKKKAFCISLLALAILLVRIKRLRFNLILEKYLTTLFALILSFLDAT